MGYVFDPEAGKQRLIEKQKKSPQKGGLKGDELKAHNQRMGTFMDECKKNRGYKVKIMADPQELVCTIDRYINIVQQIGLFPTFNGLALFCDVDSSTMYAMENLGDERSAVLKKYRLYISEFFNQSGLAQSTNPAFSIYYGKSVLGQMDTGPIDINLNIGGSGRQAIEQGIMDEVIDLFPEEWEDSDD